MSIPATREMFLHACIAHWCSVIFFMAGVWLNVYCLSGSESDYKTILFFTSTCICAWAGFMHTQHAMKMWSIWKELGKEEY